MKTRNEIRSNIYAKNKEGMGAIHFASKFGKLEAIKLLGKKDQKLLNVPGA